MATVTSHVLCVHVLAFTKSSQKCSSDEHSSNGIFLWIKMWKITLHITIHGQCRLGIIQVGSAAVMGTVQIQKHALNVLDTVPAK